jgi:hypothetical protein
MIMHHSPGRSSQPASRRKTANDRAGLKISARWRSTRPFIPDYLNLFTWELGNCPLGKGYLTGKMDENTTLEAMTGT